MNPQPFITETRPHPQTGGEQVIYQFPNGYGASVIPFADYHTGDIDPDAVEVAVLDANGELTYDTPITDDVVRVTKATLPALLERIAEL
jgi:hypothetical protein